MGRVKSGIKASALRELTRMERGCAAPFKSSFLPTSDSFKKISFLVKANLLSRIKQSTRESSEMEYSMEQAKSPTQMGIAIVENSKMGNTRDMESFSGVTGIATRVTTKRAERMDTEC
jgi:hypothetical protein